MLPAKKQGPQNFVQPEIRAQITKEWTKWDAYFLKQVREKYPGMFLG